MRISYFNYNQDIEGSTRGSAIQVQRLTEGLRQRGHDVHLHFRAAGTGKSGEGTPAAENRFVRWLKGFPVARRYLNVPRWYLRNFKFFREEKELIRQDQADVVLAVLSYVNWSALRAAQACDVPFVLFCDGPAYYEYALRWTQYKTYHGLGRRIERLNLREACAVTCLSDTFKGYLVNYGIDANKITVIPNGGDVQHHANAERNASLEQSLGLAGKTVVGFIGSFNFFDDVPTIAAIIKRLLERHDDLAFLFVGGGDAGIELQSELQEAVEQRRVIFTGALPHEEAMQHLTLMDIVFSPYLGNYLFYGSSMKVMEYMAAGKPTVVTALGQLKELIHTGYNGMLYQWQDYKTLEEHLDRLITDPELRRRLGKNARTTIEREWTWDHQIDKLERVLLHCRRAK